MRSRRRRPVRAAASRDSADRPRMRWLETSRGPYGRDGGAGNRRISTPDRGLPPAFCERAEPKRTGNRLLEGMAPSAVACASHRARGDSHQRKRFRCACVRSRYAQEGPLRRRERNPLSIVTIRQGSSSAIANDRSFTPAHILPAALGHLCRESLAKTRDLWWAEPNRRRTALLSRSTQNRRRLKAAAAEAM